VYIPTNTTIASEGAIVATTGGKTIAAVMGTNADVPVGKPTDTTAESFLSIKEPSVPIGEIVDERPLNPMARPVEDSEAGRMGDSTVGTSRSRNLSTTIVAMDIRDDEPSRPLHIRVGRSGTNPYGYDYHIDKHSSAEIIIIKIRTELFRTMET